MARFTQGGGSGDGSALNYVQVAGQQVTVSSAPASIINLDITTTGKPVQISVTGEGSNADAGSWVRVNLFRGNTAIGNEIQIEASDVSENVPYAINFIDDIAAGTYNYSARVTTKSSGNWTFGEVTGPVMNAVELTGFKGDTGAQGPQGIQGEPGVGGEGGDIADFVFNYDEEETNSTMTIHNHDMVIQTTRDGEEDSDISLNSADDIWINATDDIELYASNSIYLYGANGVYLGTTDEDVPNPDNQVATIGDIQAASTADFVFTNVDSNNSSMTITGDKEMTIESGADSDLNVRAGDQLWLTAGNDVILQADDTIQVRSLDGVEILSNYVDMGDAEHRWEFTQGAELILPGGGIIFNAPESSSDGGLLSTLSIIPDATNETNQYVVLDPTGPNHIHIRAGGPIDESTAELILGGERNKVVVSDSYKSVGITTAATITNTYVNAHEANNEDLMVPETSDILIGDNIVIAGIGHPVTYFSPDPNNTGFSIVRATGVTFTAGESYTFVREEPYENSWTFGSDGVLSGPAMGGVKVPALANQADGDDLLIYATGADINIQANDTAASINITSNSNTTINTLGGDRTWNFADSGVLYGPTEPGWLQVSGIYGEDATNTNIMSQENLILSAGENQGVYINNANVPGNQIAVLDDLSGFVYLSEPSEMYSEQVSGTATDTRTMSGLYEGNNYNFNGGVNGGNSYPLAITEDTQWLADNNNSIVSGVITFADSTTVPFSLASPGTASGGPGDDNLYNVITVFAAENATKTYANTYPLSISVIYGVEPEISTVVTIKSDSTISPIGALTLSSSGVAFINDPAVASNQIATIGDLEQAIETGPSEVSFTVNGGTLGDQPTFTGAPLFSGTYVKTGPMVHFQIQVDMDNITNFGTGQYYVDLPFPAKYGYQVKEGCLHDISTGRQYAIGGHVYAGQSQLGLTFTNSSGQDELFDHNSPVTLNAEDNFHIAGTYIIS